mgnify:CR=1 FL=1
MKTNIDATRAVFSAFLLVGACSRAATNDERGARRNIALEATTSSNSEFGGKQIYLAKNVNDGNRANKGHGPKFPSWGPDKVENPWLRLEWEQDVEIDHLRVFIRCDFAPYARQDHDSWWKSGNIELSTGETVPFTLEKTADGQVVELYGKTARWIKFTDLVAHEDKWCAFCEVEVIGQPAGPDAGGN